MTIAESKTAALAHLDDLRVGLASFEADMPTIERWAQSSPDASGQGNDYDLRQRRQCGPRRAIPSGVAGSGPSGIWSRCDWRLGVALVAQVETVVVFEYVGHAEWCGGAGLLGGE